MNIYYIGGSPCSGKSTIAQRISERYGLSYFKVDDHLERYLKAGASGGKPACGRVQAMSPDQIWMREPLVQCEEELLIYREIFESILKDLEQTDCENGIITEGAAYLPELIKSVNVPVDRYISITPSKEFQIFHYSKREWIPYVLEGCSDKKKAFENWMDRDALFAEAVRKQCAEHGYVSVVNDGAEKIEKITDRVIAHFGLERRI